MLKPVEGLAQQLIDPLAVHNLLRDTFAVLGFKTPTMMTYIEV
jgi:hypothetical protein